MVFSNVDVMSLISKNLFQQDLTNLREAFPDVNEDLSGGIMSPYIPRLEGPEFGSVEVVNGNKKAIYSFEKGLLCGIRYEDDVRVMVVNMKDGAIVYDHPGAIVAWKTTDGYVIVPRIVPRNGGSIMVLPIFKYVEDWKKDVDIAIAELVKTVQTEKYKANNDAGKFMKKLIEFLVKFFYDSKVEFAM